MATQHFGSVAASTVRGFRSDQFPLMLVVMKTRSAMEVCSVLQGTNSTTIYTCPTVCVFVCLFVCLFQLYRAIKLQKYDNVSTEIPLIKKWTVRLNSPQQR